jgi:hypothetical protein
MSDDRELEEAFGAVAPTDAQIERMEAAVLAAHAPLPSLTSEWLMLLRARPVANTVITFAAAAVLLLGAAISAIPWTIFGEL